MATFDAYYTPWCIAKNLVEAAGSHEPSSVADFAAGEGSLLRAAALRWSGATFIATDIDKEKVSYLRAEYPSWLVGDVDFLCPDSRDFCPPLFGMQGKIDCILLNPPFSCRGGRRLHITAMSRNFRCSIAAAFLLSALPYLRIEGQLLAIIPAGSLISDRDSEAWAFISEYYDIDFLAEHGPHAFQGCTLRTASVRLRVKRNLQLNLGQTILQSERGLQVSLFRGGIQMHRIDEVHSGGGVPLIHSTELRGGGLCSPRYYVNACARATSGPAVLIPRVGKPDISKICLYKENDPIVLSDCVIALLCEGLQEAVYLWKTLKDNWLHLERKYGGTGAPYITLGRLSIFLKDLGFSVRSTRDAGKLPLGGSTPGSLGDNYLAANPS
ncbi:MAG: hypothetical protein ABUT39_18630 [Acidobacteriota bacterium]